VPASRSTPPSGKAAATPALLQAALDLSARLLTMEAAARRVRRGRDEKAVHDFRVAARRLTAALDVWAPLLDPSTAARARRRVRRMRRELSAVRDLEVLGARLRERLPAATAAARVALEGHIARLERRLAKRVRRSPKVVAQPRILRVRRGLLRAVRRAPGAATAPPAADLARAHITATRDRAIAALGGAWARRDDEALHEARVRIKAWRYAREMAEEPAAGMPAVAELRAVQETLGTVQDLAVTARDLEREARRARRKGRLALAEEIEGLVEQLAAEKERAAAEAQRRSTTLSVVAVRDRAVEA
jgi:CHAD domain-containing protein